MYLRLLGVVYNNCVELMIVKYLYVPLLYLFAVYLERYMMLIIFYWTRRF